jgi:hypothetical protein
MASLVSVLYTTMVANEATRGRLDATRDEQFTSVYFGPDVQGAKVVRASGTASCGSGTVLVELAGSSFDPLTLAETVTVVDYVFSTMTVSGVTTGKVERRVCEQAGVLGSPPVVPSGVTPTRRQTIARSLAPTAPVVTCSPSACGSGSTSVSMLLSRLGAEPSFVLSGTRRSS